jgi:hypothetical protein
MGQPHKKSIATPGAVGAAGLSASARRSGPRHANSDTELPSGNSASVLVDRIQTRDLLRAGKSRSKGDRLRARVSFRASDGFLLSAVFVLGQC